MCQTLAVIPSKSIAKFTWSYILQYCPIYNNIQNVADLKSISIFLY